MGTRRDQRSQYPDPGWELLAAQAINDNADIVGYGRLNGETRAFLLAPNCSAVDINNNDEFDLRDLVLFWNAVKVGESIADFNGNGEVNRTDLLAFLGIFRLCVDDDDEDDEDEDD